MTAVYQEPGKEVLDNVVEVVDQNNVAFSMQPQVGDGGPADQTARGVLSGTVGRAVVRTKLLGQKHQQGEWCYEEMDMQFQALVFMADRERERVKKAKKIKL